MINILKNLEAKFKLAGRVGQFNLTVLIVLFVLLVSLVIFLRCPNSWIQGLGVIFVCVLFAIVIVWALQFHMKQAPRISEETPVVELDKNKVRLINPPDTFYTQEHMGQMLRGLLVGYDENLEPDGKVKGPASKQNYRWYTDKEKAEFKKLHKAQIAGKRELIRKQLEFSEAIQYETTQSPKGEENSLEANQGNKEDKITGKQKKNEH